MFANILQSVITLINIPRDLPIEVPRRQLHRINKSADLVRRIEAEAQLALFSISTIRQEHDQPGNLGQEIKAEFLSVIAGEESHPIRGKNCRHLYFGGLWLDEDVLMAALSAQTEGFDVRVLLDLSIARDEFCRSSAIVRLNQHGILLTTTRQTVLEWAISSQDANLRAKLKALLADHLL
jgi:hypothetical protein